MNLKKHFLLIALLVVAACAQSQPSVQVFDPIPAAPPGEVVQVQPGDTVYAIARRYKVSMRDIIELNNLQPPFQLPPGAPLTLPAKDIMVAPSMPVTVQSAPSGEPIDLTTNLSGTTTYSQRVPIPRESEADLSPAISPQALQAEPDDGGQERVIYAPVQQDKLNEIVEESSRKPEPVAVAPPPKKAVLEKTVIAKAGDPKSEPSAITRALNLKPLEYDKKKQELKPPKMGGKTLEQKESELVTALKPTNVVTSAAPVRSAARSSGSGRFLWPVEGRVLSNFGPKSGGLRNDGINIGAPRGAPVVAAEGGTIAYAGNDIPGYGNVVLIRHEDGWMTTYAHLERIYVQREATIRKGEVLGTVGMSGGLTIPQLHFEVRQGSEALNPERYL
jgi:murein DD-endopeptidase MepM/ murein hydrolase activator NlpD